jgi:hypothetical protein
LTGYAKHLERSTLASVEFELTFGREPKDGDLLSCKDVQVARGPDVLRVDFGQIIEAWQRQIPDLMCPYKFEGDRLFRHLRKGTCSPCNRMDSDRRELARSDQ